MAQLVSYEDLARLLDIQAKSVADLVARGMPHTGKNQYDVGLCFAWYVRYLHKQLNRRGMTARERDSGVDFRLERHRLMRITADLAELDLHERRGKLIPISVYERLVAGWAITIRQRVLSLPARLAGMLVGLDQRGIQDVIDREGRDMLMILSKGGRADPPTV